MAATMRDEEGSMKKLVVLVTQEGSRADPMKLPDAETKLFVFWCF